MATLVSEVYVARQRRAALQRELAEKTGVLRQAYNDCVTVLHQTGVEKARNDRLLAIQREFASLLVHTQDHARPHPHPFAPAPPHRTAPVPAYVPKPQPAPPVPPHGRACGGPSAVPVPAVTRSSPPSSGWPASATTPVPAPKPPTPDMGYQLSCPTTSAGTPRSLGQVEDSQELESDLHQGFSSCSSTTSGVLVPPIGVGDVPSPTAPGRRDVSSRLATNTRAGAKMGQSTTHPKAGRRATNPPSMARPMPAAPPAHGPTRTSAAARRVGQASAGNVPSPANLPMPGRLLLNPPPGAPAHGMVHPEPGGLPEPPMRAGVATAAAARSADVDAERPGLPSYINQEGTPPFWLTTLLVRRLPVRCTQNELLQEWAPHASYNFLFLPYSSKQRRASRYVFINFLSAEAAKEFYLHWHNQPFPNAAPGSMPLDVSEAKLQGLGPNLTHHARIGSDTKSHQPAVFDNDGERVDFATMLARLNVQGVGNAEWQGPLDQLRRRWEEQVDRVQHL